jgi:hypothetical protein
VSDFETTRDDNELLAALRHGLAQSDPVPADVAEFARAAFTWREIDAELAELDFDSIDDDKELSGVRSSLTARMLSFQAGRWMLDIEYDEASGRLIGAISPPDAYTIELHTAGAFFTAQSDEVGRFTAEGVIRGPLGMVLRFSDGQVIKTQWVVL